MTVKNNWKVFWENTHHGVLSSPQNLIKNRYLWKHGSSCQRKSKLNLTEKFGKAAYSWNTGHCHFFLSKPRAMRSDNQLFFWKTFSLWDTSKKSMWIYEKHCFQYLVLIFALRLSNVLSTFVKIVVLDKRNGS